MRMVACGKQRDEAGLVDYSTSRGWVGRVNLEGRHDGRGLGMGMGMGLWGGRRRNSQPVCPSGSSRSG